MHPRTLIKRARIERRVRQLGRGIDRHYAGQELTILVLLDGAAFFAADLARAIHLPGLTMRYLRASSYYGGRESSGQVWLEEIPELTGQKVLLVDDILDTGRTLQRVRAACLEHQASEVRTCVMLDKPGQRAVPFAADWVGFTIPSRFVIGYGLDVEGKYRHLPDICWMEG